MHHRHVAFLAALWPIFAAADAQLPSRLALFEKALKAYVEVR